MSPPPHPFWRIALGIVSQLWRWFGSPSQIAEAKVFDRRDFDLLSRFLRGAEAMLRAGLFLQAVELCLVGDVPTPRSRPPRARAKRKTQSRSVSFRVFDPVARSGCGGSASKRPHLWAPTRYYDAAPLARRAEAVLRVAQNPAPYVRRLARALNVRPRLALRINTHHASHYLVIPTALWIDTCDSVRQGGAMLCDSS